MSLGADLQGNFVCLGLLSLVCSSVFNCGLLYGGPEVQDTTFQKTHEIKKRKKEVKRQKLHVRHTHTNAYYQSLKMVK